MGENIKVIATDLDVRPLLEKIQANHTLFEQFKARQETEGSPHKDTQTIFLRWCQDQSIVAAFTQLPAIDYPAYSALPEARPLVDKVLNLVGATELGRVIIPALKPSGVIKRHADEGLYADYYERFHVCLQAQKGNFLGVQGEEKGMAEIFDAEPGAVFWFNHKQEHWCVNPTASFRVHLIIDAVAPAYRRSRVIQLPPKKTKLSVVK